MIVSALWIVARVTRRQSLRTIGKALQPVVVLNDGEGPRLSVEGTRRVNGGIQERSYVSGANRQALERANASSSTDRLEYIHSIAAKQGAFHANRPAIRYPRAEPSPSPAGPAEARRKGYDSRSQQAEPHVARSMLPVTPIARKAAPADRL